MALEILQDDRVKAHCVILGEVPSPIEYFYNRSLDAQSKGLEAMREYVSSRAIPDPNDPLSWWHLVCSVLVKQYDRSLHQKLQLTGPCNPRRRRTMSS